MPDTTAAAVLERSLAVEPLLLDEIQPTFDETIAAHTIVDALPDVVFATARNLDFLSVRTPLLSASMWVRGLPVKLLGRPEPPPPSKMVLGGEGGLPGWMVLRERPGREVVFGAVGKFWTPTITWNEDVDPDEFAAFTEPGWGKIACNLRAEPYGAQRTLLTYECRTLVTDPDARRKFARYWRLVRPFVGQHHEGDGAHDPCRRGGHGALGLVRGGASRTRTSRPA